jgi:hypothetical protein
MHTARGWGDSFAALINRLLLASAIDEGDCNIFKAKDELEPSELKEELEALTSRREFKYVNHFVNTVKPGASSAMRSRSTSPTTRSAWSSVPFARTHNGGERTCSRT